MKTFKKFTAIVLAMVMVMAIGVNVFAAAGDAITATKGTITVENAAKGETYKIFKIFDATISKIEGTDGKADSVAYKFTGDLPSQLSAAFEKIEGTDYVQKIEGKSDEQVLAAVKAYVATLGDSAAVQSVEGTGAPVVFENLDFGYYAITSTQGEGAITVDSANPDAVIYDKNSSTPTADKKVDEESYSIGDTVKYTATFNTSNWLGEGAEAKQVTSYVISDTLPDFLSDVTITSVKIITTPAQEAVEDDPSTTDVDESQEAVEEVSETLSGYTSFGTSKSITIPWAEIDETADPKTCTSKYPNGAIIEIKYQGTLTSVTNINADDTNTVKIQPNVWNPDEQEEEPWEETWEKDESIQTYAAALKKTDGSTSLAGAKFKFYGLNVEKTANGIYTVTSYDPTAYDSTEGAEQDTSKLGTEMEVDANGKLYIIGLKDGVSLKGIETEAPDGYNKLTREVTLTPQKLGEKIIKQSGEIKYDAKGNVISSTNTTTVVQNTISETQNLNILDANAVEVINEKGTELPSTGGVGTTIFYIMGAILVLGAGILLVTRRRMNAQ